MLVCDAVRARGEIVNYRSLASALKYALLSVLVAFTATSALAQQAKPASTDALSARLKPETIQQLFPGAESVTPTANRPLALEVRIGGEIKGYIFSTLDVVNATGYSGRPFEIGRAHV